MIILTGKYLITDLQLIPSLLFARVMSIFLRNNFAHGYATKLEKIYSWSLNIGKVYNHGTSHLISKLNTKKRVEKSNLSFKLEIKQFEVEVPKANDNVLSVYEAEIFESQQFSKIQKYLSSIQQN